MSFSPLELNQIVGHSSEVAKIKKKQIDKKRLEEIEEEKKTTQEDDKVFISQVKSKDPEIGLNKNETPLPTQHPSGKNTSNVSPLKRTFKESYKGNFLDVSE